MSRDELSRHVISAVLGILATGLLLSHYSTRFDQGEVMVLVWLLVVSGLWIAFMWFLSRKTGNSGRTRTSFVLALTVAAVLLVRGEPQDVRSEHGFDEHARMVMETYR